MRDICDANDKQISLSFEIPKMLHMKLFADINIRNKDRRLSYKQLQTLCHEVKNGNKRKFCLSVKINNIIG